MTKKTFLDDFAKFGNEAIKSLSSAQKQSGIWIKRNSSSLRKKVDFVTQEEFDVVREIATRSLTEITALKKQIAELKGEKKPSVNKTKAKPAAKPAAKAAAKPLVKAAPKPAKKVAKLAAKKPTTKVASKAKPSKTAIKPKAKTN